MRTETIHNLTLHHCDCMDYMRSLPDNAFELAIVDDMQVGKAGEYLFCADLIMKGSGSHAIAARRMSVLCKSA